MDYSALIRLPEGDYKELIENEMYDFLDGKASDLSSIAPSEGHIDIHSRSDIGDLLDRLVLERKSCVSCFQSPDVANELVANVLAFSSDDVASWFLQDSGGRKFSDDYWTKELSVDMKEYAGYGIRDLEECQTTAVKVVLQRDHYSGACPLGFYVKTAYPDLERDDCLIRTGRVYTREFIANNRDCFQNNLEKLEYLYKEIPGSAFMQYFVDPETQDPTLRMVFRKEGEVVNVFVKEKSVTIKESFPEKHRLTKEEFATTHPRESAFFNRVMETKNTLDKGHQVSLEQVRGVHRDAPSR